MVLSVVWWSCSWREGSCRGVKTVISIICATPGLILSIFVISGCITPDLVPEEEPVLFLSDWDHVETFIWDSELEGYVFAENISENGVAINNFNESLKSIEVTHQALLNETPRINIIRAINITIENGTIASGVIVDQTQFYVTETADGVELSIVYSLYDEEGTEIWEAETEKMISFQPESMYNLTVFINDTTISQTIFSNNGTDTVEMTEDPFDVEFNSIILHMNRGPDQDQYALLTDITVIQ